MQLPSPIRAAVGLVATAADEARHLPDRALELPMLAVSTALQASLRAQQRYARFTARGDALLSRRRPTDEPPAWATFDEPLPPEELARSRSPFDDVDGSLDAADTATAAAQLIGDLFSNAAPASSANGSGEQAAGSSSGSRAPRTAPRTPPAKKTTGAKTVAKKAPAAEAASPADGTPAKSAAKKAAAKKPAAKSPAKKAPAKKATAAKPAAAKKATAEQATAKKATAEQPATEQPATETSGSAD